MKNIQLLNKIAKCGTDIFDENYAVAENIENPDAIMVRSAVMHDMEFGDNLKAIARAGAGVNNIPLDKCAEEGIVVFNTPGANANGVKELAIAALLHDLCKVNCYKPGTRNVKENGVWKTVPSYTINDTLPYGHGEKSVYIISGFMRLTRDEAFAIRYHMGFSADKENHGNVGKAMEMFPLAFFLNCADSEAAYYVEGSEK